MIEKKVNEHRIKRHKLSDNINGDVVYYMQRDQRIHDNWALLYAQEKALEFKKSLIILVCIDDSLKWYPQTLRQYDFMMQGLKEIELECHKLKIIFDVVIGHPEKVVTDYINEHKIGVFVTDFNPLKYYQERLKEITHKINCSVYEVDAHNIVPCWIASQNRNMPLEQFVQKLKNYYLCM